METRKENLRLTQIYINEANPRKIEPERFDKLVGSVLVFSKMLDLRDVVVNETNVILGGNMRYRALTAIAQMSDEEIIERLNALRGFLKKTEYERQQLIDYWLSWKQDPTVPTTVAIGLTEEDQKEFIIKDNVGYGEWEMPMLEADFDKNDLAEWGLAEFQDIEDDDKEAEEDDMTEEEMEAAPTRCQPGDIWALGRHRIMCGDSTNADCVSKLMGGEQAHLLLTDPPYNVDYQGGTKDKMKIANDNMDDVAFVEFLTAAFNCATEAMKPGAAFYIWHADSKGWEFRTALHTAGVTLRQTLVWVKNSLVLGRQDYQWRHEPCLYGWKDGGAHYFIEDRSQSTVIEDAAVDYRKLKKDELLKLVLELTRPSTPTTVVYEDKPTKNNLHPTMKPVKLMGRLIKNSTRQHETVLDLFGGSGSTLIAAEQLDRKCFMMEFDPKYCDAILARWEKLTGEEAEKITP